MSNPADPGIYPCLIATDTGRQFDCCLWNGERWARWTDVFDPPEWDPAEHQNCRVIAWVMPEHAVDQSVSRAAFDVLAERKRQKTAEGWTPEHDDEHVLGELAQAAACYAASAQFPPGDPPKRWPWASEWWKPKDRRRDLVRAGALILAEIERIDRAAIAGFHMQV